MIARTLCAATLAAALLTLPSVADAKTRSVSWTWTVKKADVKPGGSTVTDTLTVKGSPGGKGTVTTVSPRRPADVEDYNMKVTYKDATGTIKADCTMSKSYTETTETYQDAKHEGTCFPRSGTRRYKKIKSVKPYIKLTGTSHCEASGCTGTFKVKGTTNY